MPRGRALDEGIHGLVCLRPAERAAAMPGMVGIVDPAQRLFARAGTGALHPGNAGHLPAFPVPAGAIVEFEITA